MFIAIFESKLLLSILKSETWIQPINKANIPKVSKGSLKSGGTIWPETHAQVSRPYLTGL